MFKGRNGLKTAIGCLAFVGIVQAAPVELTKLYEYSLGNNGWQEIVSMAASFNDLDNDGILEVGEEVTFSVTMGKDWWGTHNYDALKIWVDKLPGIENPYYIEKTFVWDYNGPGNYHNLEGTYSYKTWENGTKTFTITKAMDAEGDWGFAASVMCSSDLSTLNSKGNWDDPVKEDWAAWTPTIHKSPWNGVNIQGQDLAFQFTVGAHVPEPASISLIGLGLFSLAFFRRKRAK